MNYDREWYDDPVTQELLKAYSLLRASHLKSLLAEATESIDPKVQKHASAIITIDRLVAQIEQKKSKPEEEI